MLALTRRRADNDHIETWHVYYGDVRIGTIGQRAGVPVDVDQWGWSCGFYPGLDPRQYLGGSAWTFEDARAAFEEAWSGLLPHIPESAFDEWKRSRAFHQWKERMWADGKPLPTQTACGWSACFCGAPIDVHTVSQHIHDQHMETT